MQVRVATVRKLNLGENKPHAFKNGLSMSARLYVNIFETFPRLSLRYYPFHVIFSFIARI